MNIRVHQLAKQLKITSEELIDKLHSLKIDVKGHMSILDDDTAFLVKEELKPRKAAKPKIDHRPKTIDQRPKEKVSAPKKAATPAKEKAAKKPKEPEVKAKQPKAAEKKAEKKIEPKIKPKVEIKAEIKIEEKII